MSLALEESAISAAVDRLADQLFQKAGTSETIDLVGIRSRGDEVAERVASRLREKGANVRLGVLDISLYRDDFEHLHENPKLQGSEIDFPIDGARVILVDDVIFTGRTIRAALDAIFDYGRPASVELAVLIDRGHRELPVEPQYVGVKLETERLDHVHVSPQKHGRLRFRRNFNLPIRTMARKDFLDIVSLDRQEIIDLLDQAEPFKDLFTRSVKKVPALKGKTVLMLFYEPSTRTLSSFEVAAKRLSADVTIFDVPHSSVTKGESVRDTIDTLQAMRADYIVVRHKLSGQPAAIARQTGASVINAGDGAHAHPTQGLLDAFTFREKFPGMEGRKVLITGDILHSRVARSTSTILRKLGVDVAFLGPGSLVPKNIGIQRFTDYDQAIKEFGPDAVYLLRVQKERMGAPFFPSDREYHNLYGITDERLNQLEGDGTYIMHPGPINRGVELCDAVLDYERCLISQQVENGIAARMSVLYGLKPQTS